MPIALLEERAECRLGQLGPLFISAWFTEMSAEALDALDRQLDALLKVYPKVTILTVIVGATRAPSTELRERARAQAERLQPHRLGNFVVVRVSGFAGVIARTFLAGFTLFTSQKMTVLKTFEEAALQIRALPEQHEAVKSNAALASELTRFCAPSVMASAAR